MPSKLTIIGIILLILGIIPLILFSVIGLTIPPFVVRGRSVTESFYISQGNTRTVDMGGTIGSHPLPIIVKAIFTIQYNYEYDCEATFVLSSTNAEIGERDVRTKSFSGTGDSNEQTTKSIQLTIIPPGSTSDFDVYIRIQNTGTSGFTVQTRHLEVAFTLYSTLLPGIIAFAGLVVTVVGFITGRKGRKVAKPKYVPGGWEPTLQWSGSTGPKTKISKRQPKMAIKSADKPQKVTKTVVRKKVPSTGNQINCKFCGKPVSPTAYFCPNCYGKLR